MVLQKNQLDSALRKSAELSVAGVQVALSEVGRDEITEIVHELRLHQVELEAQNNELRRVQLALSESRDRYWDLYDAAPVGYVTLSSAGQILESNLTASTLLGVERANLTGKTFYSFLTATDAVTLRREVRSLSQDGDRCTCDLEISGTDGVSVDVHAQCILSAGPQQAPQLRISLTDITALRKAEAKRIELEQKLQQKQRLESLGTLAGGIAHDFNNLLVGIVTHTELLQETNPTAQQQASIQQVQAAATRSAELCGQMLAYAGKGKFDKTVFDLAATVRETGELLSASILKQNVSLRYEAAENLPGIEGDVTSIRQVIMNLILNAAEAIGTDDGTISVKAGQVSVTQNDLAGTHLDDDLKSGDYIYLDVTDTGCGIDAESIAKMFDPFFTTKFTGRGLGLASVLGIVRSHHGAINVESKVGQGATVRVLLPASEKLITTRDRVPLPPDRKENRQTVLLVDDQELVRSTMRAKLEACNYSVLCAADGNEAIKALRGNLHEVSIVLLDLTMPGPSAATICERLHSIVPDLPVLLMSGFTEEDALTRCDYSNIAGFVPKPLGDFVSAIDGVLDPVAID